MKSISINDFTNTRIKDADVIRRIISGEKELFEILLKRNNQKLYRVIRTYLKNEAEIEDVMQNSYLKAFVKLYQFKLEASFSTWLIRIGKNEALARLKEKGKRYHLNQQLGNDALEIQDFRQSNPQEKMIEIETKYLLERAIDNLSIKYREVYILKEIEGMSVKEVADALEITIPNVKVRAHRARIMLKESLYRISNNDKNIFKFGFCRCDKITKEVMSQLQHIGKEFGGD